ncbi:aspartate/glutamate racemase family protein [Cohnella candidum]|uniref:Amino acid racemase n=1 Tax=Cohnella candidum TaxID=2674991 RepID=A0A3G3K480_9BACL|nr:amino acid racemase [Cohnella candidum]AYQ74847.1 amino acid racemase [Cohnella candidum]
MENKRLGIIGGMGPKATSVFMDRIIDHTVAERDQDHIDMLVLNHATLPDRTEVILENDGRKFLTAIEPDFRFMEHAGVSHIAIPCNTSHYFYDDMQGMTTIPIINMVEETLKVIAERYGKGSQAGLLATNGTVRSGVYRKAAERLGIRLYEPDASVQQQVMDIIYDFKKGKKDSSAELESVVRQLLDREGCDCAILACTELSCIPVSEETAAYCADAMDVLVRKSIELSGKRFG